MVNLTNIESNVKKLVQNLNPETFIEELLTIYGTARSTIFGIKNGGSLKRDNERQVIIRRKLLFEPFEKSENLHRNFESLVQKEIVKRYNIRFVIATDFQTILAKDIRTGDMLDAAISDLYQHYEFFLPWAGKERYEPRVENPADVKATEKMARIYDEIVSLNPEMAKEDTHALNVFLTRLLFCFFAEDTGIFPQESLFTRSLVDHTSTDGSDLSGYLQILFASLDKEDKSNFPSHMRAFPYVNGTLFSKKLPMPKLSAKARSLIIDCGEFNWKQINPDIFGAMFQSVTDAKKRSSLGQHYTSVPNIMKVIEPLFLNELNDEFNKAKGSKAKLVALWDRIAQIRIFDPACGSGNFLIIAFKQLRILEMKIIMELHAIQKSATEQLIFYMPRIELKHFFGLEIDDFACELAVLSLWLAQHQMNIEFKNVFGDVTPTLPLCQSGRIICGNALRVDWNCACPKEEGTEIFVLGNPPYEGARKQDAKQKADMARIYKNHEDYKDSDYITAWFLLASQYIKNSAIKFAFVSTNSICQGEQVSILWKRVFQEEQEIFFAYPSFKWSNNAKKNAGVVCVIVGVQNHATNSKILFSDEHANVVDYISPYLTSFESNYVEGIKGRTLTKSFPKMVLGSMARDGGALILSNGEKIQLLKMYPEASIYIKRLYGSQEFIWDTLRWCLWIEDENVTEAMKIPEIKRRIDLVRKFRQSSSAKTTNQYAKVAHRFAQKTTFEKYAIIVPSTSSDRRLYIPIGILDKTAVITNSALLIQDAPFWLFGVLTSNIHMVWVKNVCGRLGTGFRYSAELCYNTFPFPEISDALRKEVETAARNVLAIREHYYDQTMAYLYNPETMPADLLEAHKKLDRCVDRCYRTKPFSSDEERLETLFALYEKMK